MYDTSLKNTITNPSPEFSAFITQYFEDYMYVARGEHDLSLPLKLHGEELEVAKKITIQNIYLSKCEGSQLPYLAFRFDLKDLIPVFKKCFESAIRLDVKVRVGFVLYKWDELDSYITFCKTILGTTDSDPTTPNYLSSGKMEILGLTFVSTENDYSLKPKESFELLLIALQDTDLDIRKEAFWYFNATFNKEYKKLKGLEKLDKLQEDEKYYIADDVYKDKELFNKRLQELKKQLSDCNPIAHVS